MAKNEFNPNRLSFDEGIQRIEQAVKAAGVETKGKIITSREPQVLKLMETLRVDNVPEGFQKWQLPVYLNRPSQMFITVAEPNAKVGTHAHNEGDGIRFIASGSITYNGQELTTGDWMFIPAGAPYSFDVGRYGCVIVYCYCCCCA